MPEKERMVSAEELHRARILQSVKSWARRCKISSSPAKRFELAALVAESQANALEDLWGFGRYQNRIARFRLIGAGFRKDAIEARKAERTL